MQVTEDGLTLLRRRTINGGMKQGNALLRNLTLAGILACFGAMGCKQAAKPDATGSRGAPAAAPASGGGSTLANPIAATPESIAQGKKVYDMECRLCHGDSGESNGFLPMAVKLRLHDWRNPASLKDYTDGEIYTVIEKAETRCPLIKPRRRRMRCGTW